MIDFDRLEKEKDILKNKFLSAKPFPHIVIDDFLSPNFADILYYDAATPNKKYKVNDPLFSKNKFQFPHFKNFSKSYHDFHTEITSEKFAKLISYISDEEIFFDEQFYGGGLHLGTENSHLDMHADFNYHPNNHQWFRNLNLLFYLNKEWKDSYGGALKLKDARTGEKFNVDPIMNRLVIMHTRDYTLHGYDTIHFPQGTYRTVLAMYGYTFHQETQSKPKTTQWKVESNIFKQILSKIWGPAVFVKKKLFK
jgi:Rps23 Pro-64 3,4-dihydroxylase Tpa1-like proline 4-hydroxylase